MPAPVQRNPFQEVYLPTEALEDPELYWSLFSPSILSGESRALYRQGNVVLKGSNGAGKTMLLRLFSAEVQSAYLRHGDRIPSHDTLEYIGVGMNFIHGGFGGLGTRCASTANEDELLIWSLTVADMLNYFLMFELLRTVELLNTESGAQLRQELGANINLDALDHFAAALAQESCWFGALEDCVTFCDLNAATRDRLTTYRSYWNFNLETLPESIRSTKTEIGVPLSAARRILGDCGILKRHVGLMVTLDQYESLYHTDYAGPSGIGVVGRQFCRVVNSLLARRDPVVSYKIGVRPYSWGRELRVLGSDAKLERGRDYQIVDLDEILRRKENTGAWLFPKFAKDVARRRIGADDSRGEVPWLRGLESLDPEAELERYCGRNPDRLTPTIKGLPERWASLLDELNAGSRYRTLMASVWIRQQLAAGRDLPDAPPTEATWDADWWQQERKEAVLTQAASQCRQRRLYGGWDALMTLTGSQILVFLSLCREIWDIWERSKGNKRAAQDSVSVEIQSQAIRNVASAWLGKLEEFPGGPDRRDFVRRLGTGMRRALLDDAGLVHPGRTGFSILDRELEADDAQDVRSFLQDAADFGALIGLPHTTKEKTREPRTKWYLLPVLCPNFDIPAVRKKEPYYATLDEVRGWIQRDARIQFQPPWSGKRRPHRRRTDDDSQGNLFGDRPERTE